MKAKVGYMARPSLPGVAEYFTEWVARMETHLGLPDHHHLTLLSLLQIELVLLLTCSLPLVCILAPSDGRTLVGAQQSPEEE